MEGWKENGSGFGMIEDKMNGRGRINIDMSSGSRQWNVSFLRSLNDWEVDDLVSFHSLLYSHNLDGGVDKIWWVPDRKGKYAVKSFYNVLISRDCNPFPCKSI
jgi:hypothetical protein